jgi:hypothetical protein
MRAAKRNRLRPVWPWTVKRPTVRHEGESCRTVKTTFPACESTKVSVVERRSFFPPMPIQWREERRRWAFGLWAAARFGEGGAGELAADVACDEPALDEEPPTAEAPSPDVAA